jgi:hypothetical protein
LTEGFLTLLLGIVSYFASLSLTLLLLAFMMGYRFVKSRSQGYLEARFGRVEKEKWTAPERIRDSILLGGFLLTGLLVYFFGPSASAAPFFSYQLIYLFFGAIFLFRWIFRQYRLAESYNLGIAALFLIIAARGAFPGLTSPAWLFKHSGMPLILLGSAVILAGLVDYWQLARTLPPLAEESEALAAEEMR